MKAWCKHDDGRFRHGGLPRSVRGDNLGGDGYGGKRNGTDEMEG